MVSAMRCTSSSVGFTVLLILGCGCAAVSSPMGGGQTDKTLPAPRALNPADVLVPEGYRIEAVATGLNFPTGVAFDNDGRAYVTESGYSYGEVWTTPRLVRVEPVSDPDRPFGPRLSTIAVEQRVDAGTDVSPALADSFLLSTSVVDVAVRARPVPTGTPSPNAFAIHAADGQLLVEAEVSPASLAAARARWHAVTRAVAYGVLALTLLFLTAPAIEWRRRGRTPRTLLASTGVLVGLLLGARTLIWFASYPIIGPSLNTPLALLPSALCLGAIVWLVIELLERRRVRDDQSHHDRANLWRALEAILGDIAANRFDPKKPIAIH